jgi:hypothetical protein
VKVKVVMASLNCTKLGVKLHPDRLGVARYAVPCSKPLADQAPVDVV